MAFALKNRRKVEKIIVLGSEITRGQVMTDSCAAPLLVMLPIVDTRWNCCSQCCRSRNLFNTCTLSGPIFISLVVNTYNLCLNFSSGVSFVTIDDDLSGKIPPYVIKINLTSINVMVTVRIDPINKTTTAAARFETVNLFKRQVRIIKI